MSTISQNHVTISQVWEPVSDHPRATWTPRRWRLVKATGFEQDEYHLPKEKRRRHASVEMHIDHHFGKEDTFKVFAFRDGEKFKIVETDEIAEEYYRENEEHGVENPPPLFTAKDFGTISGVGIQSIIDEMHQRWNALKLIVMPDIATNE